MVIIVNNLISYLIKMQGVFRIRERENLEIMATSGY